MTKKSRVAAYALIIIAIIGILSYSFPQLFEQLQTRFLYTYEYTYNYSYVDPNTGDIITVPITILVTIETSGSQEIVEEGVVNAYTVYVENTGSIDLPLHAMDAVLALVPEITSGLVPANFTLIGADPVHTFGNFDYEIDSTNTTPTSDTAHAENAYHIRVNGFNPQAPVTLAANTKIPLFSYFAKWDGKVVSANNSPVMTIVDRLHLYFSPIQTTTDPATNQVSVTRNGGDNDPMSTQPDFNPGDGQLKVSYPVSEAGDSDQSGEIDAADVHNLMRRL
jgi:hypothetical protein